MSLHCKTLSSLTAQDNQTHLMLNKTHFFLLPLFFFVAWYERGFYGAVFGLALLLYLMIGIVFMIRLCNERKQLILENKTSFSLQILYLTAFSLYWFITNGFGQKLLYLIMPYVMGIILFGIVKLYVKFCRAGKT